MPLLKNKRQLALTACNLLGAHRWWGSLNRWSGLITLNYHRIGEATRTPLDPGVFSATVEQFEAQMRYLKTNCDVIRVADITDVLKFGSKRRCVLITFDDGYLDNYELAYPILKQAGLPATIFLATGFLDEGTVAWWDEIAWMLKQSTRTTFSLPTSWQLDKLDLTPDQQEMTIRRPLQVAKSLTPQELERFLNDIAEATKSGRAPRNATTAPWMNWDMVREMHRNGIDFGGHTVTHPVLSKCSVEQQRDEIQQSKARIETELVTPIIAFSYPIGQKWAMTADTLRLAQEAGYQWGFNFCPGVGTFQSNPFDLSRLAMEPRVTLSELRAMVRIPTIFAR